MRWDQAVGARNHAFGSGDEHGELRRRGDPAARDPAQDGRHLVAGERSCGELATGAEAVHALRAAQHGVRVDVAEQLARLPAAVIQVSEAHLGSVTLLKENALWVKIGVQNVLRMEKL